MAVYLGSNPISVYGGGISIKDSGQYVWAKYEVAVPYLSFIGNEDFTLKTANTTKNWNGTLEYSTDTSTWNIWDGITTISSSENKLYLRGTDNTKICYYYLNINSDEETFGNFIFTGTDNLKIACEGNIENLLDYKTVSAGGHPAMTNECYTGMFQGCTSLTTAPELPATSLANFCYGYMFQGCTNIKLSTTQTGDYQTAYRIPTSGSGTTATEALINMFASTGGTFTGTPSINTTYYTSNTVV